MNVGAVSNSAAELGQILQRSQSAQMELTDKMLKTQYTMALSGNPNIGAMLDTVA